jgi:hypothetical protein
MRRSCRHPCRAAAARPTGAGRPSEQDRHKGPPRPPRQGHRRGGRRRARAMPVLASTRRSVGVTGATGFSASIRPCCASQRATSGRPSWTNRCAHDRACGVG